MTAWPVDILFKASALLLLAAAVDWMLRRRASAAARHLVWTIAIAATLALPPAVTMLPSWSIASPP